MKLAIMQPYLFPYIGYFQLMNAVNEFVIYDNIEFSKKGWVNRNRILVNGSDAYFTIPLKQDSDYLDIKDRYLADIWVTEKKKILNKITESYRKAPFFKESYPIVEKIFLFEDRNLFGFILNSLTVLKNHLGITTLFTISSSIAIDHTLKSEKKVLEICNSRGAKVYINPIGGVELYNKELFEQRGVKLQFLKTGGFKYAQFNNEFIPFLSIIDVMMFNSKDEISKMLDWFTLE